MKVIVRTNDFSEPMWVGTIKGKGVHNLPIVMNEDETEQFLVAGIIAPHSPPLEKMLTDLTNKQQWDILKELKLFWIETNTYRM
jgi:hypothetical protein